MFRDAFASTNIWLIMLHDHLHCLVFKEHLLPLSRVSFYILPRGVCFVKSFFKFFFRSNCSFEVVSGALLSLSAADLHYITRFRCRCQHLFEKSYKCLRAPATANGLPIHQLYKRPFPGSALRSEPVLPLGGRQGSEILFFLCE